MPVVRLISALPLVSSFQQPQREQKQSLAGAGDEARTRDVLLGKEVATRGECHTFYVTRCATKIILAGQSQFPDQTLVLTESNVSHTQNRLKKLN